MKNLFPRSISHQKRPFLLADIDTVFKRDIWSYRTDIPNIVLKGKRNRNVWPLHICAILFHIFFPLCGQYSKKKNNVSCNFSAYDTGCLQLHLTLISAAAVLRKRQQVPRQTHICCLESIIYLKQLFYKQC